MTSGARYSGVPHRVHVLHQQHDAGVVSVNSRFVQCVIAKPLLQCVVYASRTRKEKFSRQKLSKERDRSRRSSSNDFQAAGPATERARRIADFHCDVISCQLARRGGRHGASEARTTKCTLRTRNTASIHDRGQTDRPSIPACAGLGRATPHASSR